MKMVYTRNVRNYSVQPDGPGHQRGKTRVRSRNSCVRKTYLEDARVSPHSPRSVPTNFDVNSEPELIQGNILRAEPFPSGNHRNVSVPVHKPGAQQPRERNGKYFLAFGRGHELLLALKSFLGEQKTIELIEEGVGNDPSFGEIRPSGIYQLQNFPKTSPKDLRGSRKVPKTQSQLAQSLPTRVQDPQFGTISSGQCFQYGQNSHGIHSERAGKDEQDFSMQMIDEIQFGKSIIDVELGKFDATLNKITSDINELRTNDRHSSDWHKLKITKPDLILNACDRIKGRHKVQID
ncbi:hypothetical protein O181_000883 [Austropuccinia psidii MF-1]|uniref:Uncharacterized protein n=1 Tax=Austropuccinia psidii MF-1 TaxID=1389203 RepID=A0A9Q3GB87_9BASI|nr:hypothetical protein [Austropuccinia psidii MF-1]